MIFSSLVKTGHPVLSSMARSAGGRTAGRGERSAPDVSRARESLIDDSSEEEMAL